MLNVEINHIKKQVENYAILRVQQGLEDKHKEFLIEGIKLDFSNIAFIFC